MSHGQAGAPGSDVGILPLRDFPVWHFAMVNDRLRNAALERSIEALDLRGATVVEIGSGTGLIALLFAKHGAAHVVTCEMNETLARAAQQIVLNTPYADRITVIAGSSSDAIRRGLLPYAPEIIFTETLDCGVVGEGFWSIAADIQQLAGPRTIVLPKEVRQIAAMVDSPALADLNRADTACGFDLAPLNAYATRSYFPVRAAVYAHQVLGRPEQVRRYSYLGRGATTAITLSVTRSGVVHGLISWFAAAFGDEVVTNEPDGVSHWHQAFHPLPECIEVAEGDSVSIMLDDAGCARVTCVQAASRLAVCSTRTA